MSSIDIRSRMVKCCSCGKYSVPSEDVRGVMNEYGLEVKDFQILCDSCKEDYIHDILFGLTSKDKE